MLADTGLQWPLVTGMVAGVTDRGDARRALLGAELCTRARALGHAAPAPGPDLVATVATLLRRPPKTSDSAPSRSA